MKLIEIFFTVEEIRSIMSLLNENNHRDLALNIKEQIFKQDLNEDDN
jgi:hypothetical protein